METHRLDNWGLYVLSLILTSLIFILVFIFANQIAKSEEENLLRDQFENSYKIFKDKYLFEDNNLLCENTSLSMMSENLVFHGSLISDLEERLGSNDKNVLSQKKFYSLVLLEHFNFVNEVNKRCNESIQTILFFYSNSESNIDKSKEVGRLLSYIYSNDQRIRIYSFDVDLNESIISNLEKKYNITSIPSLVINQNHVLLYPKNSTQIETFLN